MNILIFSPGYPDKKVSNYPFVKQLVDEWAKQGHNCTVVTTSSIIKNKRFVETKSNYSFSGGGVVRVFRSNIITCSNFELFGRRLTDIFHKWGIKRALRNVKDEFDLVYCHFWQSGADGFLYTKEKNIPLFVATGESDIKLLFRDTNRTFLKYVKGVVCVSSKNKLESIELGLTTPEKCEVIPNSINPSIFKRMDKLECRKKLGYPADAFIVIFIGTFKESKGPIRVCNALKATNQKIYSIFIGSGEQKPDAPNILYCGRVMHEDIPIYLNASDVFVLPTLAEGCCNAIIEAMACGLPVISSDLPFNWDVLNENNSILVNPVDSSQISNAIEKLYNNTELRSKLSLGALHTANKLTISSRAQKIIDFIEQNKQ